MEEYNGRTDTYVAFDLRGLLMCDKEVIEV